MISWVLFFLMTSSITALIHYREDIWNHVACDEEYQPSHCELDSFNIMSADDYERCGPAKLPLHARNYFLGASGRRITYNRNKDAFNEIQIIPRVLRDVSKNTMETSTLGLNLDFPIGICPIALLKMANSQAELAIVSAISSFRTIMILSSHSTTRLEEVAKAAENTPVHLWMQMYIFENRTITVNLIRRAERSGYKGIVLTADSPFDGTVTCDAREQAYEHTELKTANLDRNSAKYSTSFVFRDITWVKKLTRLPVIVKGILTGEDATRAILAGASAIMVSNHGGRQVDGAPATIEALPGVVDAVNKLLPRRDVYLDGGIRRGQDVYKAIARGAKMVFLGRPIAFSLALDGSYGVNRVITALRNEFNETMILSGATNVKEIKRSSLIPMVPNHK